VGHGATLEGAGRYLLDQAGYLADRRATVFAILPRHGPLADRLSERGVAVRYAPNPWWARPVNLTEDHLAHTARAARLMADIVLQLKVDTVYTQTIVAPTGAIAAALAGIPHIWHIHEFAFNPGAIEMSVPKEELADLMLQTSNIIVFNSRAVEREWDGMFPSTRSLETREAIEEERRLFYVAITRAKDELYLTYPQMRLNAGYGDMFQRPSRFLKEIPRALVEDWNVHRG